ncbi:MAG TPA: hypothetical protein DDW65_08025 [Firmicutes bacterium]|nr:hypothetical protein [Bacillota bacterium]
MKITSFIDSPQLKPIQSLQELNLKAGQKIVAKILSNIDDNVVLEIAGRPIKASIEGDIELAVIQTFIADTDEQGRIILRVQPSSQGISEASAANENGVARANLPPIQAVISALTKAGLQSTEENVEMVTGYLRDFQTKYGEPVNPNVFTFIMAKGWPVNPSTILAALVYQDPKVREELWNQLQAKQNSSGSKVKLAGIMLSDADPAKIAGNLRSLTGLNCRELLAQISKKESFTHTQTRSSENTEVKAAAKEKLQTILDHNIGLSKSILRETAANGAANLIPLLVNDSQNMIHECRVQWQWQEEQKKNSQGSRDQLVYITIPTVNLGDINLVLRTGKSGTRINLQVNSEEVRKYFLRHTAELQTELTKDNTVISVKLNEPEYGTPGVQGVDLWM